MALTLVTSCTDLPLEGANFFAATPAEKHWPLCVHHGVVRSPSRGLTLFEAARRGGHWLRVCHLSPIVLSLPKDLPQMDLPLRYSSIFSNSL